MGFRWSQIISVRTGYIIIWWAVGTKHLYIAICKPAYTEALQLNAKCYGKFNANSVDIHTLYIYM